MKRRPLMELNIEINDEPVAVFFTYDAGYRGDYYQPPEPESAEIDSVIYNGVDIVNVLSESQLDELADKCINLVHKGAEAAAEAAAEAEYEDRRERERDGCL